MSLNLKNGKVALVLGARGGIGGHVAAALVARGWHVRGLIRKDPPALAEKAISWHRGDALSADDVLDAARGVSLIVHAVNPPGYRDWDKLVLPMLSNTIAAAQRVGARIVLPGTVYNFGPGVLPDVTEESAQQPVTRKGAIRVEMERQLRAASERGVPVLILRSGDFFGPAAGNNWFAQGLVTPGKPVKAVSNPGTPGIGHQWAYLPDVAETMMRLLDRQDALLPFAVYHMEGVWDADGGQMALAIERVAGRRIRRAQVPWWLFRLGAPFVPLFREINEMRYLWTMPVRMRNQKLVDFLGSEPHTPLDEAVRATLLDLKCL